MSEIPATYNVEQSPIGYMPLPEVYAALDYVLGIARGEPGEATAAAEAGNAFLLPWFRAGALPSQAEIAQLKEAMGGQIDALTAAFASTLRTFVDGLDEHPCPLPGTPFGDYYPDLAQLQHARNTGHES